MRAAPGRSHHRCVGAALMIFGAYSARLAAAAARCSSLPAGQLRTAPASVGAVRGLMNPQVSRLLSLAGGWIG
jgi:hypothetical protein